MFNHHKWPKMRNQPQNLRGSAVRQAILGLALAVGAVAASSQVEEDKLHDRYKRTCGICHATGVANAPKTGVPAEWESRMVKGMDALVASVEKGMNAMPPKGMCFDCDAVEIEALIVYMAEDKTEIEVEAETEGQAE